MKKIILIFIIAITSLIARDSEVVEYKEYKVTHTEPVYDIVRKRVPYQDCWDEQVMVGSRGSDGSVGSLIGGIAGGILGNQIGEGGGRTAATVGGAIIGTIVGNESTQRADTRRVETQQRCATRYKIREARELAGYRNYFTMNGEQKYKFSTKKLDRVRVQVLYSY
jgi:uncharacterized protein YcfJ